MNELQKVMEQEESRQREAENAVFRKNLEHDKFSEDDIFEIISAGIQDFTELSEDDILGKIMNGDYQDTQKEGCSSFVDEVSDIMGYNLPEEYTKRDFGHILSIEKEDAANAPKEGSNGHWGGERGDSTWYPDPDYKPTKENPDDKTNDEIFKKYGKDVKDGVVFKDGDLDLGEVSVGTVEIDDFSGDREKNYLQADKKLSEAEGETRTPAEIRKWRKENNYTWHESKDRKTMQLVPREIHGNISHKGGVSIERKEIADKFGCTIDEVKQWIKENGSSWKACKDNDSIDVPKKDEPTTESNK